MKAAIIGALIEALLKLLSPELLKKFADMVIDFAEEAVAKSENKLDDKIVLPLCNLVRSTFDIPDND
jgi:hypothetical protein